MKHGTAFLPNPELKLHPVGPHFVFQTATSKGDGLRLLISNRPIAEARYQHGTPQYTNGWNFVPKRDLKRYSKRGRNCSWNRDNSLPGDVLADFAPLGGAWCCCLLRLWVIGG